MPPNIGDMSALRSIRLNGNPLVSLPASVSGLLDHSCVLEPVHLARLTLTGDTGTADTVTATASRPRKRRQSEIVLRSSIEMHRPGTASSGIPLHAAFASSDILDTVFNRRRPVQVGEIEVHYHPETSQVKISIGAGEGSEDVFFNVSADEKYMQLVGTPSSEIQASLVESGLVTRRLFPDFAIRPQEFVLPDEIKQSIVHDVTQRFIGWDSSKSLGVCDYNEAVGVGHRVLGLMLDSLWKNACQGELNDTTELPSDYEIDLLLQDVIHSLLQQSLPFRDRHDLESLKQNTFEPGIKETFNVLYGDFGKTPLLQDLAPEHRWRLLVDRSTIEVLERHGINGGNPLLAFVFDAHRHYARQLAKGWVFALNRVDEPVSVQTSLNIHSYGTGQRVVESGSECFGAIATEGGARRIAENMQSIARHGFQSMLQFGGNTYVQDDEDGRVYPGHLIDELAPTRTNRDAEFDSGDSVPALLRNAFLPPLDSFRFRRDPGASDTSKERLIDAMEAFMQPVRELIERQQSSQEGVGSPDSDEIRREVSAVYLREETLHAMYDGNYRLWGLLEKNRWYAKLGEGLTLVRNPNLSDGSSVAEAAEMDKEGQRFMALLSQEYKDAATSGSAFDMSALRDLVLNAPTDTLQDKVAAAKLYPKAAPSRDDVRELILYALQNNAPPAHQIALTGLPGFDAENEPEVLVAGARAGALAFCSYLFSIGANPDVLNNQTDLRPEIQKLVQAAKTIRQFADFIASTGGDMGLFLALRANDTEMMSEILAARAISTTDSSTALIDYLDSVKHSCLFQAIAIYATGREAVHEQALDLHQKNELSSWFLGGELTLYTLPSTDQLRPVLFLLKELEIDADAKLTILGYSNTEGKGVLHKAVHNSDEIAFALILDFIGAMNIPADKKLEAVLVRDHQGKSPLGYLDGKSRMARAARDWILGLPASKVSPVRKEEAERELDGNTTG